MIYTVESYDYCFRLGRYFSEYELIETYEANNLQCVTTIGQRKALGFLWLPKNQPTELCFQLFAMIQTCTCLYSSNFTPHVKHTRNQSQLFNKESI